MSWACISDNDAPASGAILDHAVDRGSQLTQDGLTADEGHGPTEQLACLVFLAALANQRPSTANVAFGLELRGEQLMSSGIDGDPAVWLDARDTIHEHRRFLADVQVASRDLDCCGGDD